MNMILDTQNQAANPERDLIRDIDRIARYLKRYGRPHRGLYEREGQRLVDLALAIATEAKRRLADQRARIAELELLSTQDPLTGLLNRRGFADRLHLALAEAKRHEEGGGVLVYIDLDGFKPINDSFGHAAGDEVLRQVASRLLTTVRETDAVGRLGGDEFAVLFTETSWHNGWRRAKTIERALNTTMAMVGDSLIAVRASVGIQAYGAKDGDADLLARADRAMYETKRARHAEAERDGVAA